MLELMGFQRCSLSYSFVRSACRILTTATRWLNYLQLRRWVRVYLHSLSGQALVF